MSLATLKKKTESKYRNSSVNLPGFSLNGCHRNQGYIGQTSLSRTVNPSICCTEKNTFIKPSVLSNSGMLAKRNRWKLRPAPYSTTKEMDSFNNHTSGDYITYKRKAAITAAATSCPGVKLLSSDGCPIAKVEIPDETKSQGEYLSKLISKCIDGKIE